MQLECGHQDRICRQCLVKLVQDRGQDLAIFRDEKSHGQLIRTSNLFHCPQCGGAYHPLCITMTPTPTANDSVIESIMLHRVRGVVLFAEGWAHAFTAAHKSEFLMRYVVPTMKNQSTAASVVAKELCELFQPVATGGHMASVRPSAPFFSIDCKPCVCSNSSCPGFVLVTERTRTLMTGPGGPLHRFLTDPHMAWVDFAALSKAAAAHALPLLFPAT